MITPYNVMKTLGYIAIMLVLLSGCASDPELPPISNSQPLDTSPVVNYALTLQGAPYRYGSDNPEDGFDCSGFIHHVYQHQGINLPRTTADMATQLMPVAKDNLQTGDLVFFNTNGKPYSHVGLYVNNDRFIHAPSAKTGRVLVSSLKNNYWQQHFIGVRRP